MRNTKNHPPLIAASSLLEVPATPQFAGECDILTRQTVELSRLDVRIAELLICLYSIPRMPGSASPCAKFTGGATVVGFHPL